MHRKTEGPPATLAQLRHYAPWLWVYCSNPRCLRSQPAALTPFIIRWGPDASSDKLRAWARCRRCGTKRATLQLPGWGGRSIGVAPFPVVRLGYPSIDAAWTPAHLPFFPQAKL
jgi:hypothetical protein